jgi:O-antigen/teichoic acid export membrane protein
MNSKKSLTYKAGLSFISQLLQMVARLIVGFGVTPIVIRGLGAELYGAWSMIQQSLGYLSLSDLRPMGTLKFTLATKQHIDDPEEKRRQVGAALRVWLISFPIFCILGVIAVWKLPLFIHVKPQYQSAVQIAIAILAFCTAMEKLFSLPANALRGMNLEYRAMGLNSAIIILNGFILVLTIKLGWGLPGVAGASFCGIFISGIVRLWVARNALSWFGTSKPSRSELINFVKLTVWLSFSTLGGLLFTSSDLLLIGHILNPTDVAVYVTTGTVLLMATNQVIQLQGSATSGLAGICGQGDWKRAIAVRSEIFSLATATLVLIGSVIIAMNKLFISLWVGPQFFGGQGLTCLLVMAALGKLAYQIDTIMMAGSFETKIKQIAISLFITGCITVILGIYLLKIIGMSGMAIALTCGYLLQWGYYQILIRNQTGLSFAKICAPFIRLLVSVLPVFALATLVSSRFHAKTWLDFSIQTISILIPALAYSWFIVLGSKTRQLFLFRLKSFFALN